MSEKRYENIGSALIDNSKPQSPKCIGNFRRSFECEKICNLLNKQDPRINYLELKIERERCYTKKQYEKWLKEAEERIKELEQENECLKDVLCEKGVSDVKCYGKRIDTGLFDDGDRV